MAIIEAAVLVSLFTRLPDIVGTGFNHVTVLWGATVALLLVLAVTRPLLGLLTAAVGFLGIDGAQTLALAVALVILLVGRRFIHD